MITKMKKLTFLVYHKEYNEFLNKLRDLGVVHVAEKQSGTLDDVELQEHIRISTRLNTLVRTLEDINTAQKQSALAQASAERGRAVLEEVDDLNAENIALTQQLQALVKDESSLLPWGDFNPKNIEQLRDAGLKIRFFICQERAFNAEWVEQYNATVIAKASSKVYFITITTLSEEVEVDAELIKLPANSLTDIRKSILATTQQLEDNGRRLNEIAANDVNSVKEALRELHTEIQFSKVLLHTTHTADNKLMLLQGWIPVTKEEDLRNYMDSQQAYYNISDPTPEDNVPILLKNNGLFAWFEPICRLYMLPKYSEIDLTPFFAPFFMIFFGLCLGDVGYGLLLLLGATAYRLFAKNIGATMKPLLSLVQVLSFSTIICGLLTGGFFGFSLYELDWPIARWLRDAVSLNNNQMFQLSLMLGVVQVLFGMILKVFNQIIQLGFKYAVSTIGWVVLLLSCLFALVLPSVLPFGGNVHLVILGLSALMIFLYNSPGKNIFVNIGLGLWDTYNMATGLLGDVLSYVRLFALGLSGGILASVFNSLAFGLAPDNVIAGPIVVVLIFVIGHAINIFMNVLGAMVHPMRLTFVEFFKNAGYEGGGIEFNPFRK